MFGESSAEKTADEMGVPLLAKIPFDRELSRLCDNGRIELYEGSWMDGAADRLFCEE